MEKLKKTTREVLEIESITCNQCGESLHNGMNYEGLIGAYVQGGYGAKLGDSVEYKFDLCETCLAKLFETFKIPALVLDEEEE